MIMYILDVIWCVSNREAFGKIEIETYTIWKSDNKYESHFWYTWTQVKHVISIILKKTIFFIYYCGFVTGTLLIMSKSRIKNKQCHQNFWQGWREVHFHFFLLYWGIIGHLMRTSVIQDPLFLIAKYYLNVRSFIISTSLASKNEWKYCFTFEGVLKFMYHFHFHSFIHTLDIC